MYISLDAYRVFYFVAQYRSFTRAAEALYSNQPNVTRTIKNLEQSLGCSLFLRSSRNVQLTPEGEELYAHISLALQQIHAGESGLAISTFGEHGFVADAQAEFVDTDLGAPHPAGTGEENGIGFL